MGELAADDVASQTRQALANVETALAANGASMDDVIRSVSFSRTSRTCLR
jgi:enamine deaminase RidA (YjgF/YER057c/UK114 family)